MSKAELCKTCIKTDVCMLDKNVCGDVYVAPNPWFFDEEYKKKSWENYRKREAEGFPCKHYVPNKAKMDEVEVVRCKDCRWGRKVCGNIECSSDLNVPTEYHGYDWFCPNGERMDEVENDRS